MSRSPGRWDAQEHSILVQIGKQKGFKIWWLKRWANIIMEMRQEGLNTCELRMGGQLFLLLCPSDFKWMCIRVQGSYLWQSSYWRVASYLLPRWLNPQISKKYLCMGKQGHFIICRGLDFLTWGSKTINWKAFSCNMRVPRGNQI